MLKEIIGLLPENSSIKIYRDGEPLLHYGRIMNVKEFANIFADVEVIIRPLFVNSLTPITEIKEVSFKEIMN